LHGLLGCTPSEMLHVSGTGLLKYRLVWATAKTIATSYILYFEN